MRGIVDMFIVKDTIWVSGIDVNGDWGVFKAAPGESLKLMTNYPKNYLMAFETSLYPTVIVNDGLNGPYISTDGGNSLRDFNEGLPKDSFHLYLSGKQVLIDGYYYLPVLSRGLYKTTKIISKTQDKAQLEGELFYVRNNPSQAYFRILYNPNLEIKKIELYKVDGTKLEENRIRIDNNEIEADLSNRFAGTYLLKVNAENAVYTLKLIKI